MAEAQKNGKPAPAPAQADPPVLPPDYDVTQTPEFQMAFAEATAKMHDEIMASVTEMLGKRSAAGSADESDIQRLARAIAMSNAEIADQGTNRKRVAPEVLEARSQALKRMHDLLSAARSLPAGRRPVYRVRSKIFVGDSLIEPFQRGAKGTITPTYVIFMSAPNLGMLPHNDAAKAIYAEFIESIGGGHALLDGMQMPNTEPPPVWMTQNGAIVTKATMTAEAHGDVLDAEPLDPETQARLAPEVGNIPPIVEVMTMDDPRRTSINVLGTVAAPATRGSISSHVA